MTIYDKKPSFVYGFHGLDEGIAHDILLQKKDFESSQNDYDWLGKGVYFWENNIERARQYAVETSQRKDSTVKSPFVLGAVLDLGNCLDLLDQKYLDFLKSAYELMVEDFADQSIPIPENTGFGTDDFDFKKRQLDCAVIRYAHSISKEKGIEFDTVRSVFWEGEALYDNAGFRRYNHVQIAVLNADCIKGVFLPKSTSIQSSPVS